MTMFIILLLRKSRVVLTKADLQLREKLSDTRFGRSVIFLRLASRLMLSGKFEACRIYRQTVSKKVNFNDRVTYQVSHKCTASTCAARRRSFAHQTDK